MGNIVNVSAQTETPRPDSTVRRRFPTLRKVLLASAISLVLPAMWAGVAYAGCSAG